MSDSMLSLEYAVLQVPDVEKAVEHYREVLGFSVDWVFGTPMVRAGCGKQFQLSRGRGVLCFRVDDLDNLHTNYQASGARIVCAPARNSDSGMREMDVEDENGNLLRFVQSIAEPVAAASNSDEECPCQ